MKKYTVFFSFLLFLLFGNVLYAGSGIPCPEDYITLTAPINKNAYTLDKNTPDEKITFSWADSGASLYELVFSKSSDFSNPVSVKGIEGTSKTFTHMQLQELLFDPAPGNGLNKYLNNTLYWTVKVGGMVVGKEPGVFYMSGMKIFKDIRGAETIVYDVSFIPYTDGTYGIWLSQNLRATKDITGKDLPADLFSDTSDGSKIMAANPAYPQQLKSIAGNYYKQSEIRQLKEKLVPPGWKYPTWNDFLKLHAAAQRNSNLIVILRHPNASNEPNNNYNGWNMNMGGFGRGVNNWELSGCQIFGNEAYISYSYDTTLPDNPDQGSLGRAFSFNSVDKHNQPADGAVPVRLLYTGDSEPEIQPIIREPLSYKPVEVYNYTGIIYYVDDITGDDNNDGKTETKAWKTLNKVNSVAFAPGTVVKFKSGGIWRGQLLPAANGESSNRIVFTSYGSGNKPIIQNSIARDNQNDWTETFTGSGIWQTNSGTASDIGNIIFNHGQACGIKKPGKESITNSLEFSVESSTVYLKCDQNPAKKYNSIELAVSLNCVDFNHRSFITFDGIAVRYGGRHGFSGMDSKDIVIRRCDISWIGGGYQGIGSRLGNGIEFWLGAENHLIENNRIWEIYDAAVTNQGDGQVSTQKNIIYRNNIIWNAEFSFEIWNRPEPSVLQDILFENNTCVNAGKGWAHTQRPDGTNGTHIMGYNNPAVTSGVIISNNIFCGTTDYCLRIDNDWRSALTLKDNLYYTYPGGKIIIWLIYNNIFSFRDYQQLTNLDTNSIFADPLFTNPGILDYRLSTNTPEPIRKMGVQQWW